MLWGSLTIDGFVRRGGQPAPCPGSTMNTSPMPMEYVQPRSWGVMWSPVTGVAQKVGDVGGRRRARAPTPRTSVVRAVSKATHSHCCRIWKRDHMWVWRKGPPKSSARAYPSEPHYGRLKFKCSISVRQGLRPFPTRHKSSGVPALYWRVTAGVDPWFRQRPSRCSVNSICQGPRPGRIPTLTDRCGISGSH